MVTGILKIKPKYRVFVETFILTVLVLAIGLFIGLQIEGFRTGSVINNYKDSEVGTIDLRLQNYYYQIMNRSSCEQAIEQNLIFGKKIYEDGLRLEKYEEQNILTDDLLLEKKRYVLLKTEFWLNSVLLKEKCDEPFHTVVYFYSHVESPTKEVEQAAISSVLKKLKERYDSEIILLPIAGDLNLGIVDLQLRLYNVTYFPSVLIDEEHLLEGFHSLDEYENYLFNRSVF